MTRSSDAFRAMTPEECCALLEDMRKELKPLYKQVENVAATTLRLRPVFLGRQPFDKRCSMIQKAMALKVNAETAAEVLAAYYMERHPESVVELLDALGVEHDEGALKDAAPEAPKDAKLEEIVEKFRKKKNVLGGAVLLKAFAAQTAIDWPLLDELALGVEPASS